MIGLEALYGLGALIAVILFAYLVFALDLRRGVLEMWPTPFSCSLRVAAYPLKGATPAARQSRFRGVSRTGLAARAVRNRPEQLP